MIHPRKKQRIASEQGFTLIEILVVVVLIAVLAGIAGPSWLGYLNRQRMRTVQEDLVEVFKQAQTNSRQLRNTQTVTINTTAAVPTVSVNGSAQKLASGNIPANTLTLAANSSPATISFDYLGNPPSDKVPFVVTISSTGTPGTQKRCVIVANIIGSVKTARDSSCDNVTSTSVGSESD